jgi:Mrp family chromosome partitioning ATPase
MIDDNHLEQQLSAETLTALNSEYRNVSIESSANILLKKQPKIVPVKKLSQFIKEYSPLCYIIDQVITTSSIYTITAKTGSGKTALCFTIACSFATRGLKVMIVNQSEELTFRDFKKAEKSCGAMEVAVSFLN